MTEQLSPTAVLFGGSGFIGSHLASKLLRRGFRVVVADIRPPSVSLPEVEYVACDVRQRVALPAMDAELVFNLAAVHKTPGHREHEYYETNMRGALNVTRWCSETDVRTLLFTSSISVYGSTERVLDETSPLGPESAYGKSKLLAEEIHESWASTNLQNRLIIFRPAVIFGPNEGGNFSRLADALKRRRFHYPGRSDAVKSCGYVIDLIEAMFFVIEKPVVRSNIFNFCYPHRYTIGEICQAFGRVAGYARPRTIPARLVTAATRLLPTGQWARNYAFHAERVEKLLLSTNVYPRALELAGFVWPTDLDQALLDWRKAGRGEFR